MTKLGLGDTGIFDWMTYPFQVLTTDPATYSNGIIDTTLNDLAWWTGTGASTLFGNNNAPVLNANTAFQNVATIVPSAPVVNSSGDLVAPLVNLTPTLVAGGQDAANFQANNPMIGGSSDASYGGTGTPSTGSTIGLWILLGVGGLVILDIVKGLKK